MRVYRILKEREVSEWEKYNIDKSKDKNNNIIFIKDFAKWWQLNFIMLYNNYLTNKFILGF